MMKKHAEIIDISNGIHSCFGNIIIFDLKKHTSKKTQEAIKKICLDSMELKQYILNYVLFQEINDRDTVTTEIIKTSFESLSFLEKSKIIDRCLNYIQKYGIVKFDAYASQKAMHINIESIFLYKSYFTIQTVEDPIRVNIPEDESGYKIIDYIQFLSYATITCIEDKMMMTLKRRKEPIKVTLEELAGY